MMEVLSAEYIYSFTTVGILVAADSFPSLLPFVAAAVAVGAS